MDGLKEGDWVRTDKGREGKVVVMSADGVRAYVERGRQHPRCATLQLSRCHPAKDRSAEARG